MLSPSATPVSTRTPGPVTMRKRSRRPGAARKIVVGVFRIQPHFNRVPGAARRIALQAAAPRNMDLKLYEVEPGRAFGNRMLDLQTGIHLHETELLAIRFVEKLHGASIAVSGGLTKANRGLAQVLILLEEIAPGMALLRGLSDAAAESCNRAPHGPRRPVVIGNDLDLDMARTLAPSCSRKTVGSPKALNASARALSKAWGSWLQNAQGESRARRRPPSL